MNIIIRPSTDVELLDRLDKRIFPADDVFNKKTNATFWWIAWAGNEPVGFAGLQVCANNGEAFLARAGVIVGYRGLGLQRRLIRVRERRARQLKVPEIVTYTSYDNTASANNLIKCGYKLYEPERKYGVEWGLYFYKILK